MISFDRPRTEIGRYRLGDDRERNRKLERQWGNRGSSEDIESYRLSDDTGKETDLRCITIGSVIEHFGPIVSQTIRPRVRFHPLSSVRRYDPLSDTTSLSLHMRQHKIGCLPLSSRRRYDPVFESFLYRLTGDMEKKSDSGIYRFRDIIGYRLANDRVADQSDRMSSHGRQDVQISPGIVLQTIGSQIKMGIVYQTIGSQIKMIGYLLTDDSIVFAYYWLSSGIVLQTIGSQIKMMQYRLTHDRGASRYCRFSDIIGYRLANDRIWRPYRFPNDPDNIRKLLCPA
ncbi:hypothetical protein BS47DRAFT_1391879 [Hydnum rufescens UP504]|uniref:Uncharacterized protein n=1 Tax=Hydnum rufescens UP504 TaxID=1448309 RepID=A0A9P6B002_9AGAM|nr:hypothetical protein BS47DRAFT_1391879 [Hydnum rufescens UP504]